MDIFERLRNSTASAYMYILWSLKDCGTYTGSARNLFERLKEHNNGRVKSTKGRRPLKLIYFEEFDDYGLARKREMYLKTGAGRDWIKENVLKNIEQEIS